MPSIASKEQERKVLEQITKLIDSLGEDSYCGCAFAGCVEMAKENIENDFGNSWQDKCYAKDKQAAKIHDRLVQATEELHDVKVRLNVVNEQVKNLKSDVAELHSVNNAMNEKLHRQTVENEKLQASLKSAAYDLLVLNARLYDMEHPKDGQFGC